MFSVHIAVRSYEVDQQGHLNQAVYAAYAEHARMELLRAAGVELPSRDHLGMVVLESRIRFLHELRIGDEIDVTAAFSFGTGKAFAISSTYTRTDSRVAAEGSFTMGLMDLSIRRLVSEPRLRLLSLAGNPAVLEGSSRDADAPAGGRG